MPSTVALTMQGIVFLPIGPEIRFNPAPLPEAPPNCAGIRARGKGNLSSAGIIHALGFARNVGRRGDSS
jgi:hypothetical protein